MVDFFKALVANDLKPLSLLFTLFLGFILSGIIGFEREHRQQVAGLRTHILICLGAVTFTLVSRFIFKLHPTVDASRIPSSVVSGIGFIAVGAIIRLGFSVKGVTTVTSIWSVAAIGVAVGSGYYVLAVFTTVFVMITLTFVGWISIKYLSKKQYHKILVSGKPDKNFTLQVTQILTGHDIKIRQMSVNETEKKIEINYLVMIEKNENIKNLADSLHEIAGVTKVEINY